MKRSVILALAAMLAAQPAFADLTGPNNRPGAYVPRDECARLPGARAFRAALSTAVARRDGEALARLAAPNVRLDFGGGAGRNTLRQMMRSSAGEGRWQALSKLLPLGCAVSEGELTLPWFFAQDLGDLDPFDVLLASGPSVGVYYRASLMSKPISQLSWQLVKPVTSFDPALPAQQVELIGGGLTGYVATSQLRSPLDYRLRIKRSGRNWQITAFISGD